MAIFQQGMFAIDPRDTPETIARKRAIIAQITGSKPAVAPRSTEDGIGNAFASIMGGIAARNMSNKADAAEADGQESAASAFNPLLDAFRSRVGLDAGGFPAAPNPGDSTSMATMPAPDTASARVAQAHGDSTAPAGNLTESKQAFINALMPAAMQESQRTGIDPRIIVAQAAQETGWGRSAPGNNYFGIKSHGKSGGQTFATHEYVNGKRVNIRDSFRRFDSPADSVRGYGDFILNNPRYRPFMAAQGLDAQLEALQASGYATDPNYSRSVGAIARGIPLDSPVAANEAMATGSLASGLTPDMLQQWAFANYAPQPANGAVDAVNALGDAQPVGVAETEADILAQEAAMAQQDPNTWAGMGRGTLSANNRPMIPNADGTVSTEESITVTDPRLNGGRPTNIPSIWGGRRTSSEDEAVEMAVRSGQQFQAFPSIDEAVSAAQARSAMLGAAVDAQSAPMQVAQAGGFPEMAGRNPQALPAPGIDMQMIANVLTNPFSNPEQRAFAQMLLEQQMQAQDPMRALEMDYKRAQTEKLQREAAGGNRRYGLNPIYGQDAQGNTVLGVLGDDGSFKPVDTGGVNISTGVDRVDLGTQWGLLDKRSGQMVGTLPKENYQEAFDTASGSNDAKSAAEARANLPKVEDNATAILGMIESLSTDPYLDSMVGPVSGRLPNVSADAARVQSKMDQIGGQAFLQAFETLRGGGQISNVEGERATAALARLNTAQSPQDYRQALEELSTIVRTSLSRARRSAGSGSGNNPPPGASGDGWQDIGGVKIRRKQ